MDEACSLITFLQWASLIVSLMRPATLDLALQRTDYWYPEMRMQMLCKYRCILGGMKNHGMGALQFVNFLVSVRLTRPATLDLALQRTDYWYPNTRMQMFCKYWCILDE
jgi:hypothetical protein